MNPFDIFLMLLYTFPRICQTTQPVRKSAVDETNALRYNKNKAMYGKIRKRRKADMTTAKWDIFEQVFSGPREGNPFAEVSFGATFRCGMRQVPVEGFYDGEGRYVVRFMPDWEGHWSFVTRSSCPDLDGKTGEFQCVAPRAGVHGPVRVTGADTGKMHTHVPATRLKYADGKNYMCVGTTCYCWTHQPEALQQATLDTLKKGYFNKIRMCVFPKHYEFNHNDPECYPFEGGASGEGYAFDFTRFNPESWRQLEKRIGQLADMGIEADLILFHPYDRWGFSQMSHETDLYYLRYAVARLAAFRNVWWSFANEYDLMPAKSTQDWDDCFRLVQTLDPAGHLRSIHNCRGFYDHTKPWVTHCSVQHSDMERVPEWITAYQKPVVIDECCYEGNIPNYWGSISAEEMVNRMWESLCWGGYAGHGETYLDPEDVLWWAKGGTLHGKSPERILFLRKIMESLPADPVFAYERTRVMGLNFGDEEFLYYYGLRQSGYKQFDLPEGKTYRAEVIDAWNMTVTPVEGTFSGKGARVPMPSRSYCGLRLIAL